MEDIEKNFEKKPKTKKGLIISLIIIALIIIALIVVYFINSKPENIFNKNIDKLFKEDEMEEAKTAKQNITLSANIDSDNKQISGINDILKGCKLNLGEQLDVEKNKNVTDLSLDYENENAIKAQVYYNDGEEYVYLDDIFDKYIKLDLSNEQLQETKETMDTMISSLQNQNNTKKMKSIISKELKNALKDNGTYSKSTETIKINGADKKVTKNTLTMNQDQANNAIKTIITNLKDNDEFIKCFKTSPKDALNQALESIKKAKDTTTLEKATIEISIYTEGITNKVVGINFNCKTDKEEVGFDILKENENLFSFKVSYSGEQKGVQVQAQAFTGTVQINKKTDEKNKQEGTIILKVNVPQVGNVTLNADYSNVINEKIDDIDVSNAVNYDDLSLEEMYSIVQKLGQRPLIGEIIQYYEQQQEQLFEDANSSMMENEEQMQKEQDYLNSTNSIIENYNMLGD